MSNAERAGAAGERDVASRLAKLGKAYRDRIEQELDRIESLLGRVQEQERSQSSMQELHQALHKLAGSAGTFGFHALGSQARRLEQSVAQRDVSGSERFAEGGDPPNVHGWIEDLRRALAKDDFGSGPVATEGGRIQDDSQPLVIWLVERDLILAGYIAQQLESFGFHVHHLRDGEELREEGASTPDLLLLDHRASANPAIRRDPVSFWRNLLAGYPCPAVFVGGEESFGVRLNAVRSGAVGYFAKPLDVPQLAATCARILNMKRQSPERVLIVEDDVEFAQWCVAALENCGMEVRWLNNPQALIETAIEFSPELVLMDLWLPEVSGAELVSILGQFERWSQLPIVYLSAESRPQFHDQALVSGGQVFIEKPLDEKSLVSICRSRVRRLREMEEAIALDGLTGLLKHASIKERLTEELDSARRHGKTISFVMLDIDHFKSVNDLYGHAIGDLVIGAVGTLLRQYFRTTDKLGRYGGEEFAIILPDCTAHSATKLVEGLRRAFAEIQFVNDEQGFNCTLSAGVAEYQGSTDVVASGLIERADRALYKAKRGGRNRVCIAEEG